MSSSFFSTAFTLIQLSDAVDFLQSYKHEGEQGNKTGKRELLGNTKMMMMRRNEMMSQFKNHEHTY